MQYLIDEYLEGSINTLESLNNNQYIKSNVIEIIEIIKKIIRSGNKILIAGNGGSAADAQHLAAEFVVRYKKDRIALPALALTTDSSVITAGGNDYSFEDIFARQIDALGNSGDLLILFSTSGKSLNIIKAARIARKKGLRNILFTGIKKFEFQDLLDVELNVPSDTTSYIQECHLKLIHIICFLIDNNYEETLINYS